MKFLHGIIFMLFFGYHSSNSNELKYSPTSCGISDNAPLVVYNMPPHPSHAPSCVYGIKTIQISQLPKRIPTTQEFAHFFIQHDYSNANSI